jgi:3-deoxy-D-arabino-heptulosonate 7-phosphate (DAHP) synthase class II
MATIAWFNAVIDSLGFFVLITQDRCTYPTGLTVRVTGVLIECLTNRAAWTKMQSAADFADPYHPPCLSDAQVHFF